MVLHLEILVILIVSYNGINKNPRQMTGYLFPLFLHTDRVLTKKQNVLTQSVRAWKAIRRFKRINFL